MSWLRSDHLTPEHRQALFALGRHTGQQLETMVDAALAAYGDGGLPSGLPWVLRLDTAVQTYLRRHPVPSSQQS